MSTHWDDYEKRRQQCVDNDDEAGQLCPNCGFQRKPLPPWADFHVVFALNGRTYRIVSLSTTNRRTPNNMHFENRIVAELLSDPWSGLPDAPCSKADVASSLAAMRELPQFYMEEITKALHVI